MGCCGYYQLAEFEGHYSSHALCPYFLNISFEKRFYAIPNVYNCSVGDFEKSWPDGYFMGYMETFERKRYRLSFTSHDIIYYLLHTLN